MSYPPHPPPSPPSLSACILESTSAPAPASASGSASTSSKHLHRSNQSIVTPPDSFGEPSSSPISTNECEREQHEQHEHEEHEQHEHEEHEEHEKHEEDQDPHPHPHQHQHHHQHSHQTQNIIQHLRWLHSGRHLNSLQLASWHVVPLGHEEFRALHHSIETAAGGSTLAAYFDDKARYDYFYSWQRFVLRMPILASHETVIRDIDVEITSQLRAKSSPTSPTQVSALKSLGSPTYDLPEDPQQGLDAGYTSHSPDASFGLASEPYPGVVLEVANTQKARYLDQLADDYIVGSAGHIAVVVAIKFNYGSSEKATLSVWRSTVAQNDEGQWEHFCQNTIRERAFRDGSGQPDPNCPGLELQLCDFALALRDEPTSPSNRIYTSPLQLCSIVDEALRSQAQPQAQRAADWLPLGFVHKKRQRTPPERITLEDEALWQEREERRIRLGRVTGRESLAARKKGRGGERETRRRRGTGDGG